MEEYASMISVHWDDDVTDYGTMDGVDDWFIEGMRPEVNEKLDTILATMIPKIKNYV